MSNNVNVKPTKYSVVVVHGICANDGSQQEGFSDKLACRVFPDETARSTYWHEAVWENVTNAADDKIQDVVLKLVDAYDRTDYWRQEQLKTKSKWWQRLCVEICWWFARLGKAKGVELLTRSLDLALDLPLYLGEPRGGKIRQVVIDAIQKAQDENAAGVVLVGHSLGSVIAYDVVRANLRSETPLKIKTLITLGSPLDWVTDVRKAEGEMEDGNCSLPGVKWINIYDEEDPVPIKDGLPIERFSDVDNTPIRSGEKLILAHTCYWENDEVAKVIRDEIS